VNARGTGVRVAHIAQTTVVDAVFTQLFDTQLETVQKTVSEAIREESMHIQKLIDDRFATTFASAFVANRTEFIGVGIVTLLLLVAWVVILGTRRRA
jgi:aspartate oxidase